MKNTARFSALLVAIALAFCCLAPVVMATAGPDDSAALSGLTEGKALFDINLSDATKLPLYLSVIKQTYDGLVEQGVDPDFVIAFRGMAVTFVTDEAADELKAQIAELDALENVRFEACAVATALFGIDNATILPEVSVVGNTFISAIGFGSDTKGYATIPIM